MLCEALQKFRRQWVGPLCPWPTLKHVMHLCGILLFLCLPLPQANKHSFIPHSAFYLCSHQVFYPCLSVSCSSQSQSLCLYLSHLQSLVIPLVVMRSHCSQKTVVRAELKAKECSAHMQAYSSVSQQPSTVLRYWLANGTDQCSLFAIIS